MTEVRYANFDSNSRIAELFASDLDTERLIMGLGLYVGRTINYNGGGSNKIHKKPGERCQMRYIGSKTRILDFISDTASQTYRTYHPGKRRRDPAWIFTNSAAREMISSS